MASQTHTASGRALDRIFNAYGAKANAERSTIKASASEVLALYARLRHWVESRDFLSDPRLRAASKSFLACCKVVDILLLAKRRQLPMADAAVSATAALSSYFQLHIEAHGASDVKPKHHWAFDVAEQLASDTMVFDAFVIERLHLRVRPLADNAKRLQGWERSVLSGVVNSHARSAREDSCRVLGAGLVGRVAEHPVAPRSIIADKLELGGFRVSVGDVVCKGECAGEVAACLVFEGELWLVVNAWRQLRKVSAHSATWCANGHNVQTWRVSDAEECVAWKVERGEATVIRL